MAGDSLAASRSLDAAAGDAARLHLSLGRSGLWPQEGGEAGRLVEGIESETRDLEDVGGGWSSNFDVNCSNVGVERSPRGMRRSNGGAGASSGLRSKRVAGGSGVAAGGEDMLDKVEFRLQHCEAQEALLPPTAAVKNRHRGRRRSSVDLGDLEGKLRHLRGSRDAAGVERAREAPQTPRDAGSRRVVSNPGHDAGESRVIRESLEAEANWKFLEAMLESEVEEARHEEVGVTEALVDGLYRNFYESEVEASRRAVHGKFVGLS